MFQNNIWLVKDLEFTTNSKAKTILTTTIVLELKVAKKYNIVLLLQTNLYIVTDNKHVLRQKLFQSAETILAEYPKMNSCFYWEHKIFNLLNFRSGQI